MDKRLYELLIVSTIGILIVVIVMLFVIVILMNYKRWANKRDEYYKTSHDNLEKKVNSIESATNKVIEKATDVVNAASEIIKK